MSESERPYLANYNYSLTGEQQQTLQLFLRSIRPEDMTPEARKTWDLLHKLTYAADWSPEARYPLVEVEIGGMTLGII